jgi:Lrp/AsnC family transcriptional regulator, leucine-responsive regulatory protein
MALSERSEERQETFDREAPLDGLDWRILEGLQENARITFSELGRRVSLTPPAVAERVRRMEEAGVISGYRVELDHAKVGLPIMAFVRLRAAGDTKCLELGEITRDIPEILECHRVTGEDSYIVKVAVRSVEHLERLVDSMMPYAETVTSLVFSSPVTGRSIHPPARLASRRTRRSS